MNDDFFETFVLYYCSWQDGEFPLSEMKQMLVQDIGTDGLAKALAVFRAKRLEREVAGIKKTLYDTIKESSFNEDKKVEV